MRTKITSYVSLLLPLAFFSIVSSYAQCPNNLTVDVSECGEVQVSVNEFGEVGNIIWYWGDETQSSGANFVSHQYEESGTYNVCVAAWTGACEEGVEFCTEIEVEVCDNPCELDVESVHTGDSILFYPYNYPNGAIIEWTVNENWGNIGNQFFIAPTEPGIYEVCAMYETPECPEGVVWCESFIIEDEGECPGEGDFGFDMIDCDSWVFEIGSFVEGAEVHWNFGDGNDEWAGHVADHTYQEDGQYIVSALYYSPFCEDSVYFQETIEVDCEGANACELDVEVVETADSVLFYAFNYPDGASLEWTVNGNWDGVGDQFFIIPSEPGVYEVCVMYETPECPEGVFWCETWIVEDDDCPFELSVEETEACGCYELSLNGQWGGQYIWNLGDTIFTNNSEAITHCYNPGNYTGYVQVLESNYPECEQEPLVFSIEVPECDGPCELDVTAVQDGDSLYLNPENYPGNADIWWTVNGENYGPSEFFTFNIGEPGTYEICAAYETPECPEGVFWCETWIVEDDDCPFELSVEETEECGCYELSLNGQWGGQYIWNLGDTIFTNNSEAITHCYDPGNYTGYLQVLESNYPECEQQPVVFSVEVPECEDPECTWFDFEVSISSEDLLPFELEWELTEQNGTIAGDGGVYLTGDTSIFTGEVCLVPGCYTLTLSSDLPIGLEDFEFDFPVIPGVPISIDWIQDDNPFTLHSQIDLAGDCDWTVGIEEQPMDNVAVYPVPATGMLNIQLDENASTEVRLYDTTGKLVHQENMRQSGTIDVSRFPAGYYLLQLQQGKTFKTFSVPLLN